MPTTQTYTQLTGPAAQAIRDGLVPAAPQVNGQHTHHDGEGMTLYPAQTVRVAAVTPLLVAAVPAIAESGVSLSEVIQELAGWVLFGDDYDPDRSRTRRSG